MRARHAVRRRDYPAYASGLPRDRAVLRGIVAWGFWKTYFAPLLAARADHARHRPPACRRVRRSGCCVLIAQAAVVVAGRRALAPADRRCRNDLRRTRVRGRAVGQRRVRRRCACAPGSIRSRSAASSCSTTSPTCCCSACSSRCAFVVSQPPRAAQALDHRATAALVRRRARARRAGRHAAVPAAVARRRFSPSWPIDLATRRRVHPVPLVSSALIVVAFFKVPLFAAPVWRDVGASAAAPICLSSPRLFYDSSRIWTEGWPATA